MFLNDDDVCEDRVLEFQVSIKDNLQYDCNHSEQVKPLRISKSLCKAYAREDGKVGLVPFNKGCFQLYEVILSRDGEYPPSRVSITLSGIDMNRHYFRSNKSLSCFSSPWPELNNSQI
jgi:hypothetical protein